MLVKRRKTTKKATKKASRKTKTKTRKTKTKARSKRKSRKPAKVGSKGRKIIRAGHKKIDGRHYRRSDTGKIATWDEVRDAKIKAKYKGPPDQPWIGDTRKVTVRDPKTGKKIKGWI